MLPPLRDYQTAAVAAVARCWKNGAKRVLLVSPTGSGKTRMGLALVQIALRHGKRVLWLAHRDFLLGQAHDVLWSGTGLEPGVTGPGGTTLPSSLLRVATVQTLVARGVRPGADVVVWDECFPAGTLVDGRAIETLKVGDFVWCVDHATGNQASRRVARTFTRKYFGRIIRLTAGNRGVECTEDHPVFVRGKGYVKAVSVTVGDVLCVQERVHASVCATEANVLEEMLVCDALRDNVAYESHPRTREDAGAQPDEARGVPGKDGRHPEEDRARARGTWREREGGHGGGACGGQGHGDEDSRGRSDEHAEGERVPGALQDRRGGPGEQGGNRGGREFPWDAGQASAGREEGRILTWARVDRVESVEPTGSDGIAVYNLEVEGCHTYFANEILVHNCHHHVSDEWGKVAADYASAHGFGLTATPERSDGRPLGDLFDSIVVAARYSELIDAGHLVPARVFAPDGALSRGLASDPVKAYQAHGAGGQAFVFAASVELAYKFAEDFNRLGISAACIEGTTDGGERERLLERFKAGELRVLTNVYVLTEGLDVPAASVCVLARGVGHVTPYLQMVGRVLRPAPGKTAGVVIDLSGTTYKHGLPTEDRDYSLTEGVTRKPKGEGSLRVCQSCGMTFPGTGACPRCGFAPESRAKPPTIYDMALREVYAGKATPEDAKERWLLERVLKEPNKPFAMLHHEYRKLFDEAPRAGIVPESIRRSEYQRLVGMAKSSGNKVGWAAHRYRNTFGDWPPREWQT